MSDALTEPATIDDQESEESHKPAATAVQMDELDCPVTAPPWMATFSQA